MVQIKTKDGIKYVVNEGTWKTFIQDHCIPYREYLEYTIRKVLGQSFADYNDYQDFKKKGKAQSIGDHHRPEHLRFKMCGQRDSDGGIEENREIFRLFNLPITLRSSYDYEEYNPNDYGNIFIFHKGTPILFRRGASGELMEVAKYGGWGTVEILVELMSLFAADKASKEEVLVY